MPHTFAHTLYELRRKAGKTDFPAESGVIVLRTVTGIMEITVEVVQNQARGPTYFVEDDALRRNYIANPSFEHDLTSWTESITATGTTARDSTQKDSGKQSLKLDMTNSGASGQVVSRYLDITGLAASEVWSVSAALHFTALSNSKVILRMEFLDSGDSVLATHNVERTTTTTAFVTLDNDNRTSPANTVKLRVSLILEATAIGATGTAFLDSILAEKASVSGSYFDGDTTGCFWETNVHNGESLFDVDGTAAICGYFKASA